MLNDLNLTLYEGATNDPIDEDLTSIDNVHQVTSDRSGTQVIRAYAWSTSFYHGEATDTYALATPEGTTLAAGPILTPSAPDDYPPLYAKSDLSVRVNNTGLLVRTTGRVVMSYPGSFYIADGSSLTSARANRTHAAGG